jgi:hypothetical protein
MLDEAVDGGGCLGGGTPSAHAAARPDAAAVAPIPARSTRAFHRFMPRIGPDGGTHVEGARA